MLPARYVPLPLLRGPPQQPRAAPVGVGAPAAPARAAAGITWTCPINETHKFTGAHDAYQRFVKHFETGAVDDSGQVVGPHPMQLRVVKFDIAPTYEFNIGPEELRKAFGAPVAYITDIGGVFSWDLGTGLLGTGFFILYVSGPAEAGYEDLTRDPHFTRIYHGLQSDGRGRGDQPIGKGARNGLALSIPPDRMVSGVKLASYGRDAQGKPSGFLTSGSITLRGYAGARVRSTGRPKGSLPAALRFAPVPTSAAPIRGMRSGQASIVYDFEVTGDPGGQLPALYLATLPEFKGESGNNWQDTTGTRLRRLTLPYFHLMWGRQTAPQWTRMAWAFPEETTPEALRSRVQDQKHMGAVLFQSLLRGKPMSLHPGFLGYGYPFDLGCDETEDDMRIAEERAEEVMRDVRRALAQKGGNWRAEMEAVRAGGRALDSLSTWGPAFGRHVIVKFPKLTPRGTPEGLFGPAVMAWPGGTTFISWVHENQCARDRSVCDPSKILGLPPVARAVPIGPVEVAGP